MTSPFRSRVRSHAIAHGGAFVTLVRIFTFALFFSAGLMAAVLLLSH